VTKEPRVLVVDDVPQILEFFENVASKMKVSPFTLVTRSDPRAAMQLIEETDFDVIVSDFRMPHVNGVELLTRARSLAPAGRRVLMTGYNEIPVTKEALKGAQIDAYLQKPLAAQEIVLLLWGLIAAEPVALEEYRKEARLLEEEAVAAHRG
jgi:DNA-binding NtrC family response regulator